MYKKQIKYIVFLMVAMIFIACNQPVEPSETPPTTEAVIPTPDFDKDSAYSFVEKQVSFGSQIGRASCRERV